jgi:pseudouridine kinase
MILEISSKPDAPVLVIGSAGIDILGRLSGEFRSGSSNPAEISSSFGGVARNVAENLAHLGQPVFLLSAIGSDLAGDQMIQQLSAAGVDVSAVLRSEEWSTGSYLAVFDSKGTIQYALDDMRSSSFITPEYLHSQAQLFKQASLVFLDANLSPDALRSAVALARRARIPICADPTSAPLIYPGYI